jgi:multisubunit Na+/H+ antiporter MnhB subunit
VANSAISNSGTRPQVDLGAEAAQLGNIDEEVAKARIRSMDADVRVRVWMALIITLLFTVLNAAVIYLVWKAFNADISLLKDKLILSDQRLITENVFMSLIGATVVQVGVTLVAITGYLFPRK